MADRPVIDPNPKTLPDILASLPDDTPIVMLNLLRFRDKAQYKDGEADYLAGVIAPEGETWHSVLLVRYPSKQAFASMLADPEYSEATRHRTAALEEARLVAMQEG